MHLATGRWFLTTPEAEHALRGVNPVGTLTIVYAAVTGFFLWLSSLAAGAASNWSAYRRLPEATREDARIKRIFGKPFAQKLGDFVEHNLGGMIGYAALGFLLGFMPVLLSRFFGIALEVRHVTLHAAAAAYGILPMRDVGELMPSGPGVGRRRHRRDRVLQLHGVGMAGTAHGRPGAGPDPRRPERTVEGAAAGVLRQARAVLLGAGEGAEGVRDAGGVRGGGQGRRQGRRNQGRRKTKEAGRKGSRRGGREKRRI